MQTNRRTDRLTYRQTDRQTDGRLPIAIPRFALDASRGKKLLEKVQRRFTRMIPGLRNRKFPYETRLKRLNLWTLEDRRIRANLKVVLKMVLGLSVVACGHWNFL